MWEIFGFASLGAVLAGFIFPGFVKSLIDKTPTKKKDNEILPGVTSPSQILESLIAAKILAAPERIEKDLSRGDEVSLHRREYFQFKDDAFTVKVSYTLDYGVGYLNCFLTTDKTPARRQLGETVKEAFRKALKIKQEKAEEERKANRELEALSLIENIMGIDKSTEGKETTDEQPVLAPVLG